MPDVPSGFTHIPTIMLAERLSDTYGCQASPGQTHSQATPPQGPSSRTDESPILTTSIASIAVP
jgi:hypothetical protein